MGESSYGTHLTLRVSKISNSDALEDSRLIDLFLKELVHRIDMRILAGPLIAWEDGPYDKRGCSGVVILYESHVAIHAYPGLSEAFIDIFSCRPFNEKIVFETITGFFGQHVITEHLVADRGSHWNDNINIAIGNWMENRLCQR